MNELAGIKPRPHASFPYTYSTYIILLIIPIASDEAPRSSKLSGNRGCNDLSRAKRATMSSGGSVLLPARAVFPSSISGCLE